MNKLTALWLAFGLGYGALNAGAVLAAFENGEPYTQHLNKKQAAVLEGTKPEEYAHFAEKMQRQGIRLLHYGEAEYPEALRQIPSPPPVLYCMGNVGLLNTPLCIGVVGTRRPSAYGIDAVKLIGRGLASEGVCLVSGLAAGLDAEAHKAALGENGPTIACIAFGHEHCYPKQNRGLMNEIIQNGLVVGEYPPDTEPQKPFFLQRNRLIAGITQGLVVAEARNRSGTMSTVNFAAEFGRDVFSVPGSIFSPLSAGTNALVREGAHVATCAGDVLGVYGLLPEDTQSAEAAAPQQQMLLSEEAALLHKALNTTPQSVEQLCTATGFASGILMGALTELELAGLARQHAGRRFTIEA